MGNDGNGKFHSMFKTILCFVVFIVCIPFLIVCLLILSAIRFIWRSLIVSKNSQLKFVKKESLRSVSYTVRNPGIVNIILHLEGEPNIDVIRDTIGQGVLQRRNKIGELLFPKLKSNLVTCWGFYAWKSNHETFNIENHITLYPSNYRGRTVTESNVQEYISNIVSKYLPPDLPPWQICVIPLAINSIRSDEPIPSTSTAQMNGQSATGSAQNDSSMQQYYVVTRIHHLLLSEEPNLRLSDLLSIETMDSVAAMNIADTHIQKSPLLNIISTPVHIPQLFLRLQFAITNFWNEFLSKYDSYIGDLAILSPTSANEFTFIQDPKSTVIQKRQITTLPQLLAALLISIVTIGMDFCKGFHATKNHPLIKLKFFNTLIRRECKKRCITWQCIHQSITKSISPIYIMKTTITWICSTIIVISITWPHLIYRECKAFHYCFFHGHAGYPHTITGFLFTYVPLVFNTIKESMQFIGEFIHTPRYIYEELIQCQPEYQHSLQKISMCGRKVLTWSEKIDADDIRRACIKHNVSPTDIYMAATSSALMELMYGFESMPVPNEIRVFATHRLQDYLRGKLNMDENQSGHLCLKLPLEKISRNQLKCIRQNFDTARKNQVGLYFLFLLHKKFNILTKILPMVWTVVIFNYLSRRFTVSITEITESKTILFQKRKVASCWDHKILDVLYFSPPQSNGSISLSIQQYGDHVQLGVITDAQVHPLHVKLSERWTENLRKLF